MPAVHLLRRHYPAAIIVWVVNEQYTELLDLSVDVDDVIAFPRNGWARPGQWGKLRGFFTQLRARKFDVAFDFQGLFRSSMIALSSGSRRRVGFRAAREGASWLYTEKILLPANLPHAVDKNLFLVRSALGITETLEPNACFFKRDPETAAQVKQLRQHHGLTDDAPLLTVAPAARWASKAWPVEFFSDVLDRVTERVPDVKCCIVGNDDEASVGDDVVKRCSASTPINLMGQLSLKMLVQMVRESNAVLTNDTGPLHVAAALMVPTVALFGPTDPDLTGPYGAGHSVLKADCQCAPCFHAECPREKRLCTNAFSPVDAANRLLQVLQTEGVTHQ